MSISLRWACLLGPMNQFLWKRGSCLGKAGRFHSSAGARGQSLFPWSKGAIGLEHGPLKTIHTHLSSTEFTQPSEKPKHCIPVFGIPAFLHSFPRRFFSPLFSHNIDEPIDGPSFSPLPNNQIFPSAAKGALLAWLQSKQFLFTTISPEPWTVLEAY